MYQEQKLVGTVTNLPYEKSVLKFEENGKYGLIDFEGNIIAKAIYEEIASVRYKEGEILAKKDGKYGVLNNKGVELISFEYEEIEADKYYRNGNYSESGYIVKSKTQDGYRYGYVDSKWKEILKTEYTDLHRILEIDSNDVYIIASKNGRYGVIKNSDVKIDFIYQTVEYSKEADLYAVQRTGQYGVLNIDGKTIVDIEYKGIKFNGLYILAETQTEEAYFDKKGEKVEGKYTGIIEATDAKSYITIDSNNLYGIANEKGEEVVKNEYLYIEYAFNRFFVAYKEGKGLGVIDKDGNVVVDFKYDVLSKVGEHPLLKGKNMEKNTTTVYSKDMNEIVTLESSILDIHNDYVEIFSRKSATFVDIFGEKKEAKEVLKNNKLFAACKDGKWGFLDKDGNVKIDYIYDFVTEFNSYGFAGVEKNGKWGIINEDGNMTCECMYEFDYEEEVIRPMFINKYYKTYTENNEIYYSDEVQIYK